MTTNARSLILSLLSVFLLSAWASFSVSTSPRSALIAGGGPAGMATAMMLSQWGWAVTIVEKRHDVSFDSDRAYMYLIDGRGQRCTGISLDRIVGRDFRPIGLICD